MGHPVSLDPVRKSEFKIDFNPNQRRLVFQRELDNEIIVVLLGYLNYS